MDIEKATRAYHVCFESWQAGLPNLETFVSSLGLIIREELWQSWEIQGRIEKADSFRDFITRHPPAGLGADPETVRRVIEKTDPDLEVKFREAMNSQGVKLHDNVMEAEQGNSRAYTLTRLQKDYPEIFERVKAGELSANAGAIEAGFRKKRTPLQIALAQVPKLTPEERATLKAEL